MRVLNALRYKIRNDRYYKYVEIDYVALEDLPEVEGDVSERIRRVESEIHNEHVRREGTMDIVSVEKEHVNNHPSSVALRLPNPRREMDEVRLFVENMDLRYSIRLSTWLELNSTNPIFL